MAKWAVSLAAITVAALALATAQKAAAGDISKEPPLLRLDGPTVDIKALAEENLHGLGLPVQGLFSTPLQFGVILWDEVKPGQPAPPSPQPSSFGQGQSNLNGSIR